MGVSTSPATGSRGQITIGEELFYGVPVQPTHLIDFTSESISATENVLESVAIRSDRGKHKLVAGSLDVAGDISFEQSTAGFGMLLRHALGDYLRVDNADGGIRARVARDASTDLITMAAVDAGDAREAIVLADDVSAQFGVTGLVAAVYRDANNALVVDNNTAAGFAYSSMNMLQKSYVLPSGGVNFIDGYNASDTGHSGGITNVESIVLAPGYDESGQPVAHDVNLSGGIVTLGAGRVEYQYFEAEVPVANAVRGDWTIGTFYAAGDVVRDPTDNNWYITPGGGTSAVGTDVSTDTGVVDWTLFGAKLYFHPASTPGIDVSGETVIVHPTLTLAGASFDAALISASKVGSWLYEYDATEFAGVYTHHMERGRELPVGLTVEVDRDAAIFLYSGCKVNTLTLNFETNSIVTGTFSLVGRKEYAMGKLIGDVNPGAGEIVIDSAEAFASSGILTIGEETGIEYTAKTDNGDGTWTLTLATTDILLTTSVQRHHVDGENVDSRASTAVASPYEGNDEPLTSFETVVYMDGYFEEVLAASITLNNNLNTDKFGLGSRFRLQIVEQRAMVEANLTMEFDDGKHYKKFMHAENFSLEVKCVSEADTSEIGATGVLSQAYYYLPKCKFNGTTPNIADDSYITHDMPIMAVVDDDLNTTDLVIVLVNDSANDVEA